MTEFWVCFSCCIAEQPQPKRRRRIDRSMIGEPTNFVHTTHVGSGDMGHGLASVSFIHCSRFNRLNSPHCDHWLLNISNLFVGRSCSGSDEV
uniref:CRIB domain-containing protein n=1 Tax=Xiphophorus couchianus TaxID=32473 RepID=A0A3B5M990_9TELE